MLEESCFFHKNIKQYSIFAITGINYILTYI